MADWSQLPKELLGLIADRLDNSFDLLRFRSVCCWWRSSVSLKPPGLPALFPVIPDPDFLKRKSKLSGYYLSKRSIYIIRLPESQNPTNEVGWLIKVEEDVPQRKHLLNPLSRFQFDAHVLDFPGFFDVSKFQVRELAREYILHHVDDPYCCSSSASNAANLFMEKVVLMPLNSEEEFVLLTIHVSGRLALFRPGDRDWTIIQYMSSPFDDVLVYKGKFYAVDSTGRTVLVELSVDMSFVADSVYGGDKKYLIESKGELLLVDMYLSMEPPADPVVGNDYYEQLAYCVSERTVWFKIFKLDEGEQKWVELNSLGDVLLFLGDDISFSALASDFGVSRGDYVIFADNFFFSTSCFIREEEENDLQARDVGVFDYGDGSIGPLREYSEYSKVFWPPPRWIYSTVSEVQNQLEELAL